MSRFSLFVLVLWGASHAAADPMLSFEPTTTTVAAGEAVTLTAGISGGSALSAFQFDVTFDPSVLSVVDITEGTFLSGAGPTFFLPGTVNNSAGTVQFVADTLLGPTSATGDGSLASITFDAIGKGASTVNFANVLLVDSAGNLEESGTALGTVTVTGTAATPEPSSLGFLVAAMAALCVVRSRARAEPSPTQPIQSNIGPFSPSLHKGMDGWKGGEKDGGFSGLGN
jgi:general secretion pathway protein D